MYTHKVTTECERGVMQYRISFKHGDREIKAIYFDANHVDTQRNIAQEIVDFYKVSVPEFEKKLKRLTPNT